MKSIEEAINAFSNQLLSEMNKETYTKDEIGDMFDKILMHVHSLPLADRLTDEEREKVLQQHGASIVANTIHGHEIGTVYECLERIFGKEMFAEKGGVR